MRNSDGNSQFEYTSLEGYVDAVVLVDALEKAGSNLTRASLLSAFQSVNINLGGVKVAFSPSDHQGSKSIFYTVVKDGKAMPITKF
jgi:branched-chain amino acid transport system substrate-binding protein